MKGKNILLILIAVGLFSCEKEKLEPRKNTRLSVAFIQEIDEDGALFAANIYEFGSEEVLEYGFEYEPVELSSVGGGEKVSVMGKPENYFEIKATHSMRVGQKYKVNAYLRTESGITFSANTYFVSQGSSGFIYEKMEVPEVIYYGDTMTVFAKNLSVQKNNYKVTVNGIQSPVFEVGEGYFKFTLSGPFKSGFEESAMGLFDFKFDVAGKVFEMKYPLKFKEPKFYEADIQFVNFLDRIIVKGEFLDGTSVYQNVGTENVAIDGVVSSKTSVSFVPNHEFYNLGNSFFAIVRGKKYDLPIQFQYKPPEILPGQKIKQILGEYFKISGNNFNFSTPEIHKIIIDDKVVGRGEFVQLDGNSEILFFSINSNLVNYKRFSVVKIRTFDVLAKESFELEFTYPKIPFKFIPIPNISFQDLNFGIGNSFNNQGWLAGGKNIYRYDALSNTLTLVSTLPNEFSGYFNNSRDFSVIEGELLYFSKEKDKNNIGFKDFYSYNLKSNSFKKLPDLPVPLWKPQLVHIWKEHLYIEGGIIIDSISNNQLAIKERYKYDLNAEKWISIAPMELQIEQSRKVVSFNYKGNHYSLGNLGQGLGLYQFNETDENWNWIKNLPFNSNANEIHIIGEEAYILGNSIWNLNLNSFEFKNVSNLDNIPICTETISFLLNGKIYIFDCYNGIDEYDPNYFTY